MAIAAAGTFDIGGDMRAHWGEPDDFALSAEDLAELGGVATGRA